MKATELIVLYITNATINPVIIKTANKLAMQFNKTLCFALDHKTVGAEKMSLIASKLNAACGIDAEVVDSSFINEESVYMKLLYFEAKWSVFSRSNAKIQGMLQRSRCPILILNWELEQVPDFSELLMPMNNHKRSKEKILWSCAFGKYLGSKVNVLVPKTKDAFLLKQINSNLFLAKKFLRELFINYGITREKVPISNPEKKALQFFKEGSIFCMVLMIENEFGLLHFTAKRRLIKLIFNRQGVSCLLLKSRDDLYLPCV